ncbi:hypothetical protein BV25DRAFT_1808067 [Artomyces pyxidatus]|uniref:Uncharacterized protein n=1 Tax=Artomyces pyxidatus TaxID=48021 RepID=A0ACB8SWF5_9AGAM|nr:hypothetical protein BV25DRAFT_1808067 [Artomyces pyxidatus]
MEACANLSRHAAPKMIFPGSIVRVSKDSPTTVFTNSSHVVLTPQDSMFYQWYLNGFTFDRCIISAAVPDAEHLNTGNKSYAASGDLGSIEVWNVSYPDSRMRQLSWVQKPSRIALLGTLNFTHRDQLDMWQLQPPTPRFDCPDGRYTVEIACNACRIELEQVFSMPAMGMFFVISKRVRASD